MNCLGSPGSVIEFLFFRKLSSGAVSSILEKSKRRSPRKCAKCNKSVVNLPRHWKKCSDMPDANYRKDMPELVLAQAKKRGSKVWIFSWLSYMYLFIMFDYVGKAAHSEVRDLPSCLPPCRPTFKELPRVNGGWISKNIGENLSVIEIQSSILLHLVRIFVEKRKSPSPQTMKGTLRKFFCLYFMTI